MDEHVRKAQRSAHAKRGHDCPCGQVHHGNGWKAHARRCPDYLETYGWAWDDWMATALRRALRESLMYADDLTAEQRSRRFVEAWHAESIAEAKRRGLLDEHGKAKRPPVPAEGQFWRHRRDPDRRVKVAGVSETTVYIARVDAAGQRLRGSPRCSPCRPDRFAVDYRPEIEGK
jgi:hypothetical protein